MPRRKQEADASDASEPEFEVETIVDMKGTGSSVRYCVKWKGYTHDDNTWEPLSNLSHAQDAIDEFMKTQRESSRDKSRRSSAATSARPRGRPSAVKAEPAPVEEEIDAPTETRERKPSEAQQSNNKRRQSNGAAPAPPATSTKRRKASSQVSAEDEQESELRTAFLPNDDASDSAFIVKEDNGWTQQFKSKANWHDLIKCVEDVERNGSVIIIKIRWTDDTTVWIENSLGRQHCPNHIIDFYEKHLHFTPREAA